MRKISLLVVALLLTIFSATAIGEAHTGTQKKPSRQRSAVKKKEKPVVKRVKEKKPCWNLMVENVLVEQAGLVRMGDDGELKEYIAWGVFVSVPDFGLDDDGRIIFGVDPKEVDKRFRYVLPATYEFLNAIALAFFLEYGKPLKVVSLIRTEKYHIKELEKPGKSDTDSKRSECRSVHPAGVAFDISKLPLKRREEWWLEAKLRRLMYEGMIHVIFEENGYHIMVSPYYPFPFAEKPLHLLAELIRRQKEKR